MTLYSLANLSASSLNSIFITLKLCHHLKRECNSQQLLWNFTNQRKTNWYIYLIISCVEYCRCWSISQGQGDYDHCQAARICSRSCPLLKMGQTTKKVRVVKRFRSISMVKQWCFRVFRHAKSKSGLYIGLTPLYFKLNAVFAPSC